MGLFVSPYNFEPLAVTLVILMIWQLIVRVLDVPTYIFPASTDVVARRYRTDQPQEGLA